MSCPTCSHTLQQLGCCVETGRPFWWCPRCGTIKPCDSEGTAPALVLRCQQYEKRASWLGPQWHGLGIAESINHPGDRGGETTEGVKGNHVNQSPRERQ